MDAVNHPKHHAGYPATVECIDITRHLSFDTGNAIKYVWRAGKKGDKIQAIEDLKKAKWYLNDWYRSGENETLNVARSVFDLIDKTSIPPCVYEVIDCILFLDVDEASTLIDKMIEEYESN